MNRVSRTVDYIIYNVKNCDLNGVDMNVYINTNAKATKAHIDFLLEIIPKLVTHSQKTGNSRCNIDSDINSEGLIDCYLHQLQLMLHLINSNNTNNNINNNNNNTEADTIGIGWKDYSRYYDILGLLIDIYNHKSNSQLCFDIRRGLCYHLARSIVPYLDCNDRNSDTIKTVNYTMTMLYFMVGCLNEMTCEPFTDCIDFWIKYFDQSRELLLSSTSGTSIRTRMAYDCFVSMLPQLCQSLIEQCCYQTNDGRIYEMSEMVDDIMLYYDEEYTVLRKQCGSFIQHVYDNLEDDCEIVKFDKVFIEKYEHYCQSTNPWVCNVMYVCYNFVQK